MSDTISRQAAIDATWFEPSYTDPLNVLTEVRDRLKALPSEQPERNEFKPKQDLISRTKLFNKLATVHAPPEANEYKAEVYKIIQSMGTEENDDK